MCDVEFDLQEARRETLAPWVRARLASPVPWTEPSMMAELQAAWPGLCPTEERAGDLPEALQWRPVFRQVLQRELERPDLAAVPRKAPIPQRVPLATP